MKYIALDIGNVLCKISFDPFVNILSETFDISIQDAKIFFKRFQRIHDLGYTTMEDEIKSSFSTKSEIIIQKIVNTWNYSVQPDINILNKLNHLREDHDLKIALLSNIGLEHASMMEEKLKHNNFFPNAIKHFSCEVGARKPSLIYYQSFLWQYPEFKGCLYVDDLQDNLNAGEKLGFKPFHFDLNHDDVDQKIIQIENLIKE